MCGIAGILRFDGQLASRAHLQRMADRLRHRGPDGEGFHVDGALGLAHRRLAILDPEGGAQPLSNEDGSVWITLNGEIYNFRELRVQLEGAGHTFQTRCDTEAIVHAYEEWGAGCIERLRGMFAFALWDAPRRRLLLARDRLGIKPLYYLEHPSCLAFASEIQALAVLPEFDGAIELEALDLYLHFQYVPAPRSIYKRVRKLEPAHTLEAGPERAGAPRRYWKLEYRPERRPTEAEWIERVDDAVRESVGAHLVSDVPFGAFLSGGVDSSLVVAKMSEQLATPVQTFSIGFDRDAYDETAFARFVAEKLRTEHHEQRVRPDVITILPKLVRHYGEPFADSSAIPTYEVSALASRSVKMVLSGDGGDENFAGYESYASTLWEHRPPDGAVRKVRFALGSIARAAGLRRPLPSADEYWFLLQAYFGPERRAQLWRPEHARVAESSAAWLAERLRGAPRDLCARYQQFDIGSYLPNDILTKVDVASMCHGLEVRVPLLDHRLVELAARIPSDLNLRRTRGPATGREAFTGKYILKKVASRYFPDQFLHRRKQGFSIPVGEWLGSELRPYVQERLLSPASPLNEWFDPQRVRALVRDFESTTAEGNRLWSLLFLAEWAAQRRELVRCDADPAPEPAVLTT